MFSHRKYPVGVQKRNPKKMLRQASKVPKLTAYFGTSSSFSKYPEGCSKQDSELQNEHKHKKKQEVTFNIL
jgi:hypothetical protein